MNRIGVLFALGAALIVAGCGTSKAEENTKSAKTQFAAGQPCAASALEPTETSYKTACEAKQQKEKSEREATERQDAIERKANEEHQHAEQKAAAAKTKREEAKTKHEEEKTKQEEAHTESTPPPSSSSSGGKTVPSDVVGKSLPAAESELEGLGIQFSHETNNGDAVILSGDWGVCSTTPSGGEPVSGSVTLHLGHFQCGA